MRRRVLCVAAHPDDESIGCGGTLAQHAAAGDEVSVLWLTSGEAAGDGTSRSDLGEVREREARAAADELGVRIAGFWRLPDGRLTTDDRHRARLAELLQDVDVLYAHHPFDDHLDHAAAAEFVSATLAELPDPPDAWGYEIWTPISRPMWVNDISDHIEAKLSAIRAHRTQCELLRFDDAAEGLARYRAHLHCWPGTPTHAEAFAALATRTR